MATKRSRILAAPEDRKDPAAWQKQLDTFDRAERRTERRQRAILASRHGEVAARSTGQASRGTSDKPETGPLSEHDAILSAAVGKKWLPAYSAFVSFHANLIHRGHVRGTSADGDAAFDILRDLFRVLERAERCVFPEGKALDPDSPLTQYGARGHLYKALEALFKPREGTVWLHAWEDGGDRHVAKWLWPLLERGDVQGGAARTARPTRLQAIVMMGVRGFNIEMGNRSLSVQVPPLKFRQLAALALAGGYEANGDSAAKRLRNTENTVRKAVESLGLRLG